jgi:hypothetical protein
VRLPSGKEQTSTPTYNHNRHTRKPLIPSSMVFLVTIGTLRRLVTSITVFLAAFTSRHGNHRDVPLRNFFQFIS